MAHDELLEKIRLAERTITDRTVPTDARNHTAIIHLIDALDEAHTRIKSLEGHAAAVAEEKQLDNE